MDDEEMIAILEEIVRTEKSGATKLRAMKELRELRAANDPEVDPAPEVAPVEPEDSFSGLYAVDNPGRARQAS